MLKPLLREILKDKQRSQSNSMKKIKFYNWLLWLKKLAKRKGIEIHPYNCAYGCVVKPIEIRKLGRATLIKTKFCDGCEVARFGKEYPCSILKRYWLVVNSEKEIKEGEKIRLKVL